MTVGVVPPPHEVPSPVARAGEVLRSEWTKLISVRSTFWTLAIAAVTAIGGSTVVAVSTASVGKAPFDPLASVFIAWLEYPVLAVGVLGVLTFTSEYSTGQIRTTFAAVPRRLAVLAAKASVVGVVVLALGEVLAFGSFFLSEAVLTGHHQGLSLSRAGELRGVMAGGFSLFVIAIVGLGLGALVRHTAGAVAALPALVYLPLLALSLPPPWDDRIARFTLLIAAYQVTSLHPQAGLFSPAISMLVLAAWPGAILFAAAVLVKHRDA